MKRNVGSWMAGSCLIIAVCGSVLPGEVDAGVDAGLGNINASSAPDMAQVQGRMAGLSVPFEANSGQTDKRVAFTARTLGGTLFVTRAGQLVYSFPGLPVAEQEGSAERQATKKRGPGWALTETFVNAYPVVRGGAHSATHVSRFIGNDPAQWHPQIATFQSVSFGAAWPGITVELAARGNSVEKIFAVAPGADAQRIAIRLRGAKRLELSGDGTMIADTGNGPVSFTAPVAWQDIDGARQAVSVAYALTGSRYGFVLGEYNPAYPVIIDPLVQATYLGGSTGDQGLAIAVDVSGNVFVTGFTYDTDFPGTTGGAQSGNGGGIDDAFVAKLNNGLTTLTQATYLGGGGNDQANAIAIDASGNIFVAGETSSTNFPGTTGGAQTTENAVNGDGFVAKLNNGLTTLIQATYLGGTGGAAIGDNLTAIALDAGGNVLVAGFAASTNFPGTTGGAQPTNHNGSGGVNGIVAKLSNGLTMLIQATYLGGTGTNAVTAIALDAGGNVFVTGNTHSTNFPGTAGGAQTTNNDTGGQPSAFVAKLNNGLTTLTQATYLGGSGGPLGGDSASAIALDGSTPPNVFLTGTTYSTNFPGTIGGAQTANNGVSGAPNAFVAKLSNGLTTLTQATYLGSTKGEEGYAIALDSTGAVFVAGLTSSSTFPGTTGGAQGSMDGGVDDAFVAKFNNGLTTLTQATYLGGSGYDQANAIARDASGNVFVTGNTTSSNFPGTTGGAQTVNHVGSSVYTAFVAKLTPNLAAAAQTTYSVTYDGNGNTGGTVPTDANAYATGGTVTVLGNTGDLVKAGYAFVGWNTAANGSGTSYVAGNAFGVESSNVTLYAQWTLNSSPTSVVSRKIHGSAGTFDLSLSAIPTNPTTEPRRGPSHTIVFTFSSAVTAATASITEGVAAAGTPTFSGNDVVVGLTGVADQQYVTVTLGNVALAAGGVGGGSVRIGFLVGDVNQNRVVTVADLGLVNAQLAQFVTATNFLKDVNADGHLTVADKGITNANLTRNLPAP